MRPYQGSIDERRAAPIVASPLASQLTTVASLTVSPVEPGARNYFAYRDGLTCHLRIPHLLKKNQGQHYG